MIIERMASASYSGGVVSGWMLDISLRKLAKWVGLAKGGAGWRSAVRWSIRSISGVSGHLMVCASIWAGECMFGVGWSSMHVSMGCCFIALVIFTVSAGERLLGWSWGLGTAVAVLHWFGLLLGGDSVCVLVEMGLCALFMVEEIVRFVTS